MRYRALLWLSACAVVLVAGCATKNAAHDNAELTVAAAKSALVEMLEQTDDGDLRPYRELLGGTEPKIRRRRKYCQIRSLDVLHSETKICPLHRFGRRSRLYRMVRVFRPTGRQMDRRGGSEESVVAPASTAYCPRRTPATPTQSASEGLLARRRDDWLGHPRRRSAESAAGPAPVPLARASG